MLDTLAGALPQHPYPRPMPAMSDTTATASPALPAASPQLTRQQLAAEGRSAPGKVTGKLKTALHAMIWLGMKRAEAAAHSGLKEQSLYVALARPHVRGYYLQQLEVLRTSERARNIHTLAEVRDQTSNQMARVTAVKALEQLEDQPASVAARANPPGLVIVIQSPALMEHQRSIEAKPLIEHDPISQTD